MSFVGNALIFTTFLLSIGISYESERCLDAPYTFCFDYCCGTRSNQSCCSNCLQSQQFHQMCHRGSYSVVSIVGSIISFIISVVIVATIVALCCGCICSKRTGVQRRGRSIGTGETTVTVIKPNQTGYSQSQYGYIQTYGQYPQGQYQVGQLPQGQNKHASAQLGYQQGAGAPYPANSYYGNPPPYYQGYGPDRK